MKPLNAHEFWSLDRDERRTRIEHAEDTNTCSVCCKPILAGQPRNGLHHSHYECSDLGPVPTSTELGKTFDKIDRLLFNLQKPNRR